MPILTGQQIKEIADQLDFGFRVFWHKKYANTPIVPRTVAQIPWRSNITLLDKLKDNEHIIPNSMTKEQANGVYATAKPAYVRILFIKYCFQ